MRGIYSLTATAVAVLVLGSLFAAKLKPDLSRIDVLELKATGYQKWYRGNMHTHSYWSDGNDYLESIALWYRDHDYQFLVFTDHNTLADRERWIDVGKVKAGKVAFEKLKKNFPDDWIVERTAPDGKHEVRLKTFTEVSERFNEPGKYLLVQGEEVSDSFEKAPIHMNASNIKELIVPRHGHSVADTIQNNTDALVSQRERTGQPMMIHLNHPNFGWGITAEDLVSIRGENFFEVYNGHPSVHNHGDHVHASSDRIWDIINTRRLTEFDLPLLYGLATDDGHDYHNIPSRASEPGRGWVMVLGFELSAGELIYSLEHGKFYATNGVKLSSVKSSAAGLDVIIEASPGATYVIEFIGTRRGFDPHHEPMHDKNGKLLRVTEKYSEDIGAVLAKVENPPMSKNGGIDRVSASYRFTGDELYVRAKITSSEKHPNPSEVGEPQRAWTQPVLGPAAKK